MTRTIARLAVLTAALAAATAAERTTLPKTDLEQLRTTVREGRCDRALAVVESLRQRYPDDADLFVLEAQCLLSENGREERIFVPEAYRLLRARAKGEPLPASTAEAVFERRTVYDPEVLGRAHELLDEAVRRAPFRRDLYLGRCYLHQITGQHEKLLEAVDLTAVRLPDKETGRALLTYVDAYLARGETGQAVTLADLIAEHFGEDGLVWATVGRARLLDGQLSGSRDAYAIARVQFAESAPIARAAGEVEMLGRDWVGAMGHLQAQLGRRPQDDDALFNLAWCAAAVSPPDALPYLSRLLRRSRGRGSPMHQASVRLERLAAGVDPSTADAWHELGVYMAETNLNATALAAWDRALAEDPAHLASLLSMADLYAGLLLLDPAREVLVMAEALAPTDEDERAGFLRELRLRGARMMARAGRFTEALPIYLALEAPEENSLEIAMAYTALENLDEARAWMRRATEIPETAEEARRRLAMPPLAVTTPGPAEP